MAKRFRILVVDDEPMNIELMLIALTEYTVFTASSGHEAIDQLKKHRPDLILLDVMMPEITGFDVCKIIKADEQFADIPVIFLTSLDTLEGQLQGLELGGIDYLTKPINLALFRLRVRNHLAVKEQRDLLVSQKAELEAAFVRIKQTEKAMSDNLQFVTTLLDTVPSPIFYKDASCKYLGCNRAYTQGAKYSCRCCRYNQSGTCHRRCCCTKSVRGPHCHSHHFQGEPVYSGQKRCDDCRSASHSRSIRHLICTP
ncbi:MAG: response regulator [Desulfuromonadaceae bacterium]